MKAKKKWKKLRKAINICKRTDKCDNCEIKDFCNKMRNFSGIYIYGLYSLENFLKGFKKI